MYMQIKSRLGPLNSAARRVGAIVRAMEEGPFETLEQRVRRLERRLVEIEAAHALPIEAAHRLG